MPNKTVPPANPLVSPTSGHQLPVFKTVRLRKHADYGVVYSASRKHQSSSFSYFYRHGAADTLPADVAAEQKILAVTTQSRAASSRFGITVPRVIGSAVLRNRIKRRVRVIARQHIKILPAGTDLVLHPRPITATMPFAALDRELRTVFANVAQRIAVNASNTPLPRQPRRGKSGKGRPA